MSWLHFGSGKIVVNDDMEAETAQELSHQMDDRIRDEGLNPDTFNCRAYWCENCNCYHHISTYPCC